MKTRPRLRTLLLTGLLLLSAAGTPASAEKFYPDDPIWIEPPPVQVGQLRFRKTGVMYDFLKHSFGPLRVSATAARNTNTLGEVPDNAWFTNRHGRRRMTLEELQRGPGTDMPPRAPFTVIGGKTEGISPGFRMTDAYDHLYFVKPDPPSNPEMATAADLMGARFFYALGYHTPQNYLVDLRRADLRVSEEARVTGLGGKRRPMLERDLDDILRGVPRRADGSYRLLASLVVPGQPIGPFRFEDTRTDDPNDTVPHELRRELRGLQVLCAWLNHTDSKSINSLDTLVEENGIRSVQHYLIDFGAAFGSDSDMPKNARFGNEYIIPTPKSALGRSVAFGFDVRPWERADYGPYKAVGRFESKVFDPLNWKSNYPNPAFLRRQPDDEYWGAKLVMSFRDEEIRAIVATARYSDPEVAEYMVKVLIERRDKIGRAYFSRVAPLDNFTVDGAGLRFEDLSVKYGFSPPRDWEVSWFLFDNRASTETPIAGGHGRQLPATVRELVDGSYCGAWLSSSEQPGHTVTVYLRKQGGAFLVAGLERTW